MSVHLFILETPQDSSFQLHHWLWQYDDGSCEREAKHTKEKAIMWSGRGLTLSCCVFFDFGCVCWCVYVQINHKYPERRLLVAESCGALAPYLPVRFIHLTGKTGCPRFHHWVVFNTFTSVHVAAQTYTNHFVEIVQIIFTQFSSHAFDPPWCVLLLTLWALL